MELNFTLFLCNINHLFTPSEYLLGIFLQYEYILMVTKTRPLYTGKKEAYVREMFAAIAPNYDLLNNLLSLAQHHKWRRLAVKMGRVKPGDVCLDVCTGTGDFALELARAAGPGGQVVGADFCAPMIAGSKHKWKRAESALNMMVANAENLPYKSETFDVVTVGFGIRNVSDRGLALSEMYRVIRSGGSVVILEFCRPAPSLYRPFIDYYLFHVLPRIGAIFSRGDAYRYLPESVAQFVSREELAGEMQKAGLMDVTSTELNLGTVCIHVGHKHGSGKH